MHPTLLLALTAAGAFLVGGVPFGYLIARWRGVDIFQAGSGNLGATNVGRVLGKRFGILVFLLDFAKGAIPVAAAGALAPDASELPPSTLPVVAGLCAFLGHLYPVYLRFRGGKGVATGFGAVAVLLPLPALGAILVWLTVVSAARYVSLASLAAAVALCALHFVLTPSPLEGGGLILSSFCLLAAGMVFVRHRGNLARLYRGTENRLRDNAAMRLLSKTLHVLAVGLWFGAAIFFSFVIAPSLFHSFETEAQKGLKERPAWLRPLPPQFDLSPETRKEMGSRMAGHAISPLFDYYFLLQGICGFVAALTALGWSKADPGSRVHKARTWLVLLALATVVAGWPLERAVSDLRHQRAEISDRWLEGELKRVTSEKGDAPSGHDQAAAEREAARAEFGRLHLISLLLNLVTVALVTGVMALAASLPAPASQRPATDTPAVL